jgi:hypothetical protein
MNDQYAEFLQERTEATENGRQAVPKISVSSVTSCKIKSGSGIFTGADRILTQRAQRSARGHGVQNRKDENDFGRRHADEIATDRYGRAGSQMPKLAPWHDFFQCQCAGQRLGVHLPVRGASNCRLGGRRIAGQAGPSDREAGAAGVMMSPHKWSELART